MSELIDLAIMPSFKCNLRCWFCMYDCSISNEEELNYEKTKKFLSKVNWSIVNACGFYGGEPSISMSLYQKFIDLIPQFDNKRPIYRFIITNGVWSTWLDYKRYEFIEWCIKNNMQIIISSTPEHLKYQDKYYLDWLKKTSDKINDHFIIIKEPDEIHAQGRAKNNPRVKKDCELKCLQKDRNIRLGLKPNGDIVFQNCHGEYHIVQTYIDKFDGIVERTIAIRNKCISSKAEINRFEIKEEDNASLQKIQTK